MEEWRDIPGYEGLYQVSNIGNVRSLNYNRRKGCIHVLKLGYSPYANISLCKDGKPKHYLVHRLVAEAFIPNPNNYKEVNHIDEDKTNNKVENLEWCDRSHNINHGDRNNKHAKAMLAEKHPKAKKVRCITTGEIFLCCVDAEEKYNPEHNRKACNICHCCKGRVKTAYGMRWEYAD